MPSAAPGTMRPAGSVEQHCQVLPERDDVEVEVACARVVAEASQRHADEGAEHRQRRGGERQALRAHEPAQVVLAQPDRDDGEREAEWENGELQPRERRERRARKEEPLGAEPRPLDRGDSRSDRGERERIGDRLREHEAGVEGIRDEERAGRDRERRLAAGAHAPCDRVDGNSGERERGGVHDLDESVRRLDAADVPDRGREQRLEQRREMRRAAADRCSVEAAERPAEGRVEVLVREVVRGRVQPGERDADGEGDEERSGCEKHTGARESDRTDRGDVHHSKHRQPRQTALTSGAIRRRRRSRDT